MKKKIGKRLQKQWITCLFKNRRLDFIIVSILLSQVASSNTLQKVTYLYNSGWLIETTKEVILIDYVPNEKQQLDSFLFAKLQQGEGANKKTFILITHEHSDHFYEPLLGWHHKIDGLTTILGWNYATTDKSILKVFGRDSLTIGSFKLVSHPSTDAGSGFLISVNNLIFYHAGDHAAWSQELTEKFTNELKFIRSVAKEIDMVFIPIAQGKLGGCKSTESISNGLLLTLEILTPGIVFPMHIQCDNLTPYKIFAKQVKERFPSIVTKAAVSNNYEFDF
ncbi:MAG: MBL fold metallo-hydrolase [Chitinophagaceae bacterium]